METWIVITGSPVTGFKFYGPFNDLNWAHDEATKAFGQWQPYWVESVSSVSVLESLC